ncbi:hypothetical protein ACFQ22_13085 [Lentilactobacillus raoultii]|uniref:Uncharacterized protein n=1 Tax=Lentilactobacillus raoultii TaxID=1987503 RepID=A0ABW3PVX9_9LACO|nr:hypothetical protein [Lentilactobacillus raoultii]
MFFSKWLKRKKFGNVPLKEYNPPESKEIQPKKKYTEQELKDIHLQTYLRLHTPLWPSESVQLPVSHFKKQEDDLSVKKFYESLLKEGLLKDPKAIEHLKELQKKYPDN